MNKANQKILDYITTQIAENKTLPWQKSWSTMGTAPTNLVSGKAYRGINSFILSFGASPYWVTFKQAQALGGSVKKGSKGAPVVYVGMGKKKGDDDEKDSSFSFLKYYTVFNVADCEGIELPASEELELNDHQRIELCEKVVKGYAGRPSIKETASSSAYYSPSQDRVVMPELAQFKTAEDYYATIFHELVHSTGHENRLNRDGITNHTSFGSHEYSKEELIAEFGSAFMCRHTGIDSMVIDNQAAYLASWLKALKDNPKWLVSAASQAQKAFDHIVGTAEEVKQAA